MNTAPEVVVDVQLACDDVDIPSAETIHDWIALTLLAAAKRGGLDTDVSVRVVGIDEMRSLNHEYRQQNKPTNVLSFPAGELAGLPAKAARPLGDIVICAAVLHDEAEARKKTIADHWAHILVHGTLHLIGYDHMKDDEAADMEQLEVSILAGGGVANPYQVA